MTTTPTNFPPTAGRIVKNQYPNLGFDPEDFLSLYNPNRTDVELRKFLAFAIAVAGKQAKSTARALERVLADEQDLFRFSLHGASGDPFNYVGNYHRVHAMYHTAQYLKQRGFGCYSSRAKAFVEMHHRLENDEIDLRTCTIADLEDCYGISFKTSRFFLLYTREDQKVAALDTHVWKYVRSIWDDAPEKVPSSRKKYDEWSEKLLDHLSIQYPMYTYAMMDFYLWAMIRKGELI